MKLLPSALDLIKKTEENSKLTIFKWIQKADLRTNKGTTIEFNDHAFLWDILADNNKRIVVRKCTQVGISFAFTLKALYLGTKQPLSIIWTLPTAGLVKDFVISKFNPIVEGSNYLSELVPKDQFTRRVVYSTNVKKIGQSHFFFKSSFTERVAQAIDSDIVVIDELDFQNPEVRRMYEERIGGSGSKDIIWWIGTPSIPGFGISDLFEMSDQRHWYVKCRYCLKLQTLDWPDSISFRTKKYVCKYCRKEMSNDARRIGKWIPKYPDRPIHGYQINKLMAPWVSAQRLIDEFRNSKEKMFFNFSLGLPYLEKRFQFKKDEFEAATMDSETFNKFNRFKKVVGIDQGSNFHLIEGYTDGSRAVVASPKFIYSTEELEKELDRIKFDFAVMDMFPDQHYASKLQSKYGPHKFVLSVQRSWPSVSSSFYEYHRSDGKISLDRTGVLDHFFDRISSKKLFFKSGIQHYDAILAHLQNIIPDIGVRFGSRRKIYKSMGPDDWVSSSSYFLIGCELSTNFLSYDSGPVIDEEEPLEAIPGSANWLRERLEKEIRRISGDDFVVIEPNKIM